jgi:hypothetical protein
MSTEETVTITIAELDQYKQYEEWVLDYINKNGLPCSTFRNKFPKFLPWYNENKNKAKRLEQQKKLDDKVALLLPLLEGLPNPYDAGKAIVLAMSSGNTYSELLPKAHTPIPKDWDEDDEEETNSV